MTNYTEEQRTKDFEYFLREYKNLFKQYGHKFLAVKNESILLAGETPISVIEQLEPTYKIGSYLLQECNGDESAYTHRVFGIRVKGN